MPDTLQWYDLVRVATATLSFASLYILTRRLLTDNKRKSPEPVRNYFYAVLAFLLVSFVGATEAVLTDRPISSTLFFSLLAVLFAFKAVRTKNITELVTTAVVKSRDRLDHA